MNRTGATRTKASRPRGEFGTQPDAKRKRGTPAFATATAALLIAWLFSPPIAAAQQQTNTPNLGYVYPAGGQAGTQFTVTAGGQFLRGVGEVVVSGEGVRARIVQYYTPVRNIQRDQREELMARFAAVREQRVAERQAGIEAPVPQRQRTPQTPTPTPTPFSEGRRPVDHPLLHDLEYKSLNELAHIVKTINFPRERIQMNSQLGETVLIEISIDEEAEPGDREFRLRTPRGLTNPVVFQIGQWPEVRELEPNDPWPTLPRVPAPPPLPPVELPAILNGQIMPGDVDVFPFRAVEGQSLVVVVHARRLIPYLADAVPGWFEALVTLRDPEGREIVTADHYRFDPDPVLFYRVPKDGVYSLEIRDSIFRGREDFVYRIALGEQPFITAMMPLGARAGEPKTARLSGWNLPSDTLALDTRPNGDPVRHAFVEVEGLRSNRVAYTVGTLPEHHETEPNDTRAQANAITLPVIVNGQIDPPGDVDTYRFRGRQGDAITAEVFARRLGSPLDSLLRLSDARGEVLVWNDDFQDPESGLLTHHADSRLHATLPEDGDYFLQVTDTRRHGGEAFAYRLRAEPQRGDFAVFATPSTLSASPGRTVPIRVHVVRKHGFEGEVEVFLAFAPQGFSLSGGRVPPGVETLRMTLTAPRTPRAYPVAPRLAARAVVDGKTVERPVVPAENRMQAFLWTHLVPAEDLLFTFVGGDRRAPAIELSYDGPIRVPVGGTARVRMRAATTPSLRDVRLALDNPPPGLTVGEIAEVPGGIVFAIDADETATTGWTENLIVEAYREVVDPPRGDPPGEPRTRRIPLGFLPAISAEIVKQ